MTSGDSERMRTIDWVEKAGLDNIRSHHSAADDLKRDGITTLNVLLAGAVGTFVYASNAGASGAWPLTIGAFTLSAELFILGAILVLKCINAKDISAPTNEPRNLLDFGLSLEVLREQELNSLQERIHITVARNRATARWLNRVRCGALLSPLGAIIAFLAARLLASS